MAYRRTLKYLMQRVEGLWNDDGDLIGEEIQPIEAIYYPFDLRELTDRADRAQMPRREVDGGRAGRAQPDRGADQGKERER